MSEPHHTPPPAEAEPSSGAGRRASWAAPVAWIVCLAALAAIPLRIDSLGYLPGDDALRHAAKAWADRPWDEVLVLRPEVTMDSHPGWHAVLGAAARLTGAEPEALVRGSVVGLFWLFALVPALFFRRPAAWVLALLLAGSLDAYTAGRLLMGRPLIVSMTMVAVSLLSLERLRAPRPPWRVLAALSLAFALGIWIHPSWYLFGLPVGCFFLAREWRAGLRLAGCIAAGLVLGALASGEGLRLVEQPVRHLLLALGAEVSQATLVGEFRPDVGSPLALVPVALLLGWRALQGRGDARAAEHPALYLALAGWALGFVSIRFWTDWAVPGLLVWTALELQGALEHTAERSSPWRARTAVGASLLCFMAFSGDVNQRWSKVRKVSQFDLANPAVQAALPDPGGVLYSHDTLLFHHLFYLAPRAEWRYVAGYEPGLMPEEDLAVFRAAHESKSMEALLPWARKMGPADRLVVRSPAAPVFGGLQWLPLGGSFWSGRQPRGRR